MLRTYYGPVLSRNSFGPGFVLMFADHTAYDRSTGPTGANGSRISRIGACPEVLPALRLLWHFAINSLRPSFAGIAYSSHIMGNCAGYCAGLQVAEI